MGAVLRRPERPAPALGGAPVDPTNARVRSVLVDRLLSRKLAEERDSGWAFTEGELRMVETLAWHVAGAVTRFQAEGELRDSEASLRTIAATTGHVLYRLRFGAVAYDHVSASIEKLTGYAAHKLSEMGGLDALIEAREVIEGQALKAGRATDGETHYLARYRLRTAGGELRLGTTSMDMTPI